MSSNTVTCSFKMDRNLYNEYKSVITRKGLNVKGDIVNYMKDVIRYDEPNPETIQAMKEVEMMEANPNIGKSYTDVDQMMKELLGHV